MKLINISTNIMPVSNIFCVLFLDLHKAFDTVDHMILLCKLEEIGLGECYIRYIDNYLNGRSQVTRVSNICSDPLPVTCGVPQGSILGPLLFIVYINSLPNCLPQHTSTFLYADDTALVVKVDDAIELNNKLNESLEMAGIWFRNHRLSLDVAKTKTMVFGTQQKVRNVKNEIQITLNNEVVSTVTDFKYLGLYLDESLTFDKHVSYLKGEIHAKMRTLGRVHQYIGKHTALQLYKTLIIPDLDYGDQIYDAMSNVNSEKLQVMQNKCLRICTNSRPRTSVETLHMEAGLPRLSVRREAHTCNLVFKGLNNTSSHGVNHMFETQNRRDNNNTRAIENSLLQVPRNRIKLCEGNVRVRGPKYYDSLPITVKQKPSYESFKEAVKVDKGIKVI